MVTRVSVSLVTSGEETRRVGVGSGGVRVGGVGGVLLQ